jgi:hypothetical protein
MRIDEPKVMDAVDITETNGKWYVSGTVIVI